MFGRDVDVGLHAQEPRHKPDLTLAAIFAAPELPDQLFRQVVEILLLGARQDLDKVGLDPGFLFQFAQGRALDVLARIDAALRHLPRVALLVVDALSDEHEPVAIDEHDANAGAIRKGSGIDHGSVSLMLLMWCSLYRAHAHWFKRPDGGAGKFWHRALQTFLLLIGGVFGLGLKRWLRIPR